MFIERERLREIFDPCRGRTSLCKISSINMQTLRVWANRTLINKQMPEASNVYRNGMVMRDIRPRRGRTLPALEYFLCRSAGAAHRSPPDGYGKTGRINRSRFFEIANPLSLDCKGGWRVFFFKQGEWHENYHDNNGKEFILLLLLLPTIWTWTDTAPVSCICMVLLYI